MLKIIGGSSNPILVDDICQLLSSTSMKNYKNILSPRADAILSKFPDGETRVEIKDNMRGVHAFVIQSITNNDKLMELMLILDTLKRSNTQETTVVLPYYGYSRQDKKDRPRVPITARLVADMIQLGNVDRVVTIDLHSNQIQGFFDCPVDNLYASKVLLERIQPKENLMMVSPDKGGVEKCVYYAKQLDCPVTFCYKHRNRDGKINDMRLIGEVKGKHCIMVDDLIDSGTTLIKASNILKENGAESIEVYATHGVLSRGSVGKLSDSCIERINVTDTLDLPMLAIVNPKFNVISISEMIADCIVNVYEKRSVSKLFN